jgi:hypothetical protein
MEADEVRAWKEGMAKRGIKNERHISLVGQNWPANFGAIVALRNQGMEYWFEPNLGYNKALVLEFYKNMLVPASSLTPGAMITSSIGRTEVFIDTEKIASIMGYHRPQGEVTFPPAEDDPITPDDVAKEIYENPREYRIPHVPGKLTPAHRILNQIVCFNLYPRGTENKPQESVGKILWALGMQHTVCDWAQCIFAEMVATRTAIKSSRLPFPCLLTRIFHREGFTGRPYAQLERLDPGTIGSDFLARSLGQIRAAPRSLLAQPARDAPLKDWLKKIFCQNVAIIKSHQKMKKENREMARRQQTIDHQMRYVIQRVSGETSTSYAPPQLPEIEVSDDFVEEATETESEGEEE